MKERVLSGVRSTGNLHLGNYFGAIKNFIQMQEDYEAYFFIANLHALTTHPNPELLKKSVRATLVEYIACGLDPEKSTIYVQSDIPEISELYTLLNMLAYKGELEKCTSFKEKIKKHNENINAGLLTYPVLMASDILIHRAQKVPVGKDQEQHLEMTRNFAVRFNHQFGVDFFPEPQAFDMTGKLVKVPGLDGSGKMGKSEGEGNAIFLRDDEKTITNKLKKAVSGDTPTSPNQEKTEAVQNLFTLMKLVSAPETIAHYEELYNNCTIQYGYMKLQLAEDIIAFTKPLKERILELESNPSYINKIAKDGAEKARISARATLDGVQEIMGLKPVWK